jgi:hypothetical protein
VNKLLSIGFAIVVSFVCVAAAQSMPLAPLEQAQTKLTIPVAGGCGPLCHQGCHTVGRDGRNRSMNQLRRQSRQTINLILCPALLDC